MAATLTLTRYSYPKVQPETIVGRTVMLLEFLDKQESSGDWAQYLLKAAVNGSRLDWRRITVMGHSRGASYPPLVTKLFPAQRAIMTGGDGDGDEFQFDLPWSHLPALVPDSLYSMNPIFTSPKGSGPGQSWFFTNLRLRGNASFTMDDLSGGAGRSPSAVSAALAKKFGGARAVWDAGACNYTQSSHTKLPLMEPVWKYLLTNTAPPSAAALAYDAKSIGGGHNPEVCQPHPQQAAAADAGLFTDPIELAHQRIGYPKPQVTPSCCNRDCQRNCQNCLGANGSCEIC